MYMYMYVPQHCAGILNTHWYQYLCSSHEYLSYELPNTQLRTSKHTAMNVPTHSYERPNTQLRMSQHTAMNVQTHSYERPNTQL